MTEPTRWSPRRILILLAIFLVVSVGIILVLPAFIEIVVEIAWWFFAALRVRRWVVNGKRARNWANSEQGQQRMREARGLLDRLLRTRS